MRGLTPTEAHVMAIVVAIANGGPPPLRRTTPEERAAGLELVRRGRAFVVPCPCGKHVRLRPTAAGREALKLHAFVSEVTT